MGSVPSMQGEISHWWPLTDGGLTARCNTDPGEYQVSPHYTLHRLFQLPMLPLSDWNNSGNKLKTPLLWNTDFKRKLFNLIFLALDQLWFLFIAPVFHINELFFHGFVVQFLSNRQTKPTPQ